MRYEINVHNFIVLGHGEHNSTDIHRVVGT